MMQSILPWVILTKTCLCNNLSIDQLIIHLAVGGATAVAAVATRGTSGRRRAVTEADRELVRQARQATTDGQITEP